MQSITNIFSPQSILSSISLYSLPMMLRLTGELLAEVCFLVSTIHMYRPSDSTVTWLNVRLPVCWSTTNFSFSNICKMSMSYLSSFLVYIYLQIEMVLQLRTILSMFSTQQNLIWKLKLNSAIVGNHTSALFCLRLIIYERCSDSDVKDDSLLSIWQQFTAGGRDK